MHGLRSAIFATFISKLIAGNAAHAVSLKASLFAQMKPLINKFKPYLFPQNPIDQTVCGRFKLGLINYASVDSWWNVPFVQNWIKRARFQFHPTITGQQKKLSVSGNDCTHLWVANEVLIEQVYDLSIVPFTPDVVYDLGANIGLFSLLAAARWPDAMFVCVEPHPETFSYLAANLKQNQIGASLLQCAVDSSAGLKYLKNEGAVFQELSSAATGTGALCLKLDSLVDFVQNQAVLLKVDIEGSEIAALNALTKVLPPKCFIFIELHDGDRSLQWVKNWSVDRGFNFVQVRRRNDAIDGYLVRGV